MNVCNVSISPQQTILYDASYLALWWQILIQHFRTFHSFFFTDKPTEE